MKNRRCAMAQREGHDRKMLDIDFVLSYFPLSTINKDLKEVADNNNN